MQTLAYPWTDNKPLFTKTSITFLPSKWKMYLIMQSEDRACIGLIFHVVLSVLCFLWFNILCSICSYVQHLLLCTASALMYSICSYVQHLLLCTASALMYSICSYVQHLLLCTASASYVQHLLLCTASALMYSFCFLCTASALLNPSGPG